ncbi:MAG: hypothetical protein KJ922_04735, partial [Nanoarchaeota archaeon]|nr:hypothetical protein [Nanoarchaeota archaeon]
MGRRKKKNLKQWIENHKVLLSIGIIILILTVSLFGAKIALFIHFMLGNDILVSLSVDNQDLGLHHNEEQEIRFTAKATTNPFCKAVCRSIFEDTSSNYVIEEDEFNLRAGIPLNKEYTLTAPSKGEGLRLYKMEMECHSIPTLLCHTKDTPSTRRILITLYYNLTEEEYQLKAKIKADLINKIIEVYDSNAKLEFSKNISSKLSPYLSDISYVNYEIPSINNLVILWDSQELAKLENELSNIKKNQLIDAQYNALLESQIRFNDIINNMKNSYADLQIITTKVFVNNTKIGIVKNLIDDFNSALIILEQKTSLEQKKALADVLLEKLTNLDDAMSDEYKSKTEQELDIMQTDLNEICNITSVCANITEYSCDVVEHFNQILLDLNLTENFTSKSCIIIDHSFTKVNTLTIDRIQANNTIKLPTITLDDPKPQCCVLGKCEECCINCEERNYPIIFLHGHAMNKDLSAEFSLEGFNKIENKLENDGYLSAGTVTLFTGIDSPYGIWGLPNVPFAIKTSYYFDIFKEPE